MVESTVTVALGGALAGRQIEVDLDELTIGTLEDLESQRVTSVKAALCSLIVGGDLGTGEALSATVRRMRVAEFGALADGVLNLLQEKKRT